MRPVPAGRTESRGFVAAESAVTLGSEPEAEVDPSDVDEDVLARAFGAHGTWRLVGRLPTGHLFHRNTEAPYAIREFHVSPSHLRRRVGQALLQNWGVGVINTKGYKGNNAWSIGQDNCCVAKLASGWEVFGIFDGHGPLGHWPAERAARTVPFFLQRGSAAQHLAEGRPEEALKVALDSAEADLEARAPGCKVNINTCGATAVVALRRADLDSVYIATLGDSRAMLFSTTSPDDFHEAEMSAGRGGSTAGTDGFDKAAGKAAKTGSRKGNTSKAKAAAKAAAAAAAAAAEPTVLYETSDHKPAREDETMRIQASGGDVRRTADGGPGADLRVYLQGCNYPGIAISRSLGDCAVKAVGVSAEAEVKRWPVKDSATTYLFMASDGVWEFLSTLNVAKRLSASLARGLTPQQAVKRLLQVCRAFWKHKVAGGFYCDDITLILVPLSIPEAPSWKDVQLVPDMGPDSGVLERLIWSVQQCGRHPCSFTAEVGAAACLACEDDTSASDDDMSSFSEETSSLSSTERGSGATECSVQ